VISEVAKLHILNAITSTSLMISFRWICFATTRIRSSSSYLCWFVEFRLAFPQRLLAKSLPELSYQGSTQDNAWVRSVSGD